MELKIPEFSLVILVGASGSGKSTFGKKHFLTGEVISSDACRVMVGNDENRLDISSDAFELLYYIVQKRLDNGLLTVIDATNVNKDDRKKILALAKANHVFPVAIVLNLPEKTCIERNAARPERRHLSPNVVQNHFRQLRQGMRSLKDEGFRFVHILNSEEEIAEVQITREPLLFNEKNALGPFDLIGDVHGCFAELLELLTKLAWSITKNEETGRFSAHHLENRQLIFVGDLVDRGPDSPAVLRLVMDLVQEGKAFCVPGNHDAKLNKWLDGRNVELKHGLELTVEQLNQVTPEFREEVRKFLNGLVSHKIFDEGRLVVCHAGIKEKYIGRTSNTVREFCLYGETTGEIDEFGLPVRGNWAASYRGKPMIVYGHTPIFQPEWLNNTLCIDTGCVFGGKMTALRYPERTLVSVDAHAEYFKASRPFLPPKENELSLQATHDDLLDVSDLLQKRSIETAGGQRIKIREGEAMAAFETMTRFGVNPKWMIYLPPTMSPAETSQRDGFLEYPTEAFEYYRKNGVNELICEEKHMGSRVIIVICRSEEVAAKRFGITGEGIGKCYTRTGRAFFNDYEIEKALLKELLKAFDNSGFWTNMATDWVCLDCELLPWSAKAQGLLEKQYAGVGSASKAALAATTAVLKKAMERLPAAAALHENFKEREICCEQFTTAYQAYCWPVNALNDYKIAPFHILAVENQVFSDKTHDWHLTEIDKIAAGNPVFFKKTARILVKTNDVASIENATAWWENLTAKGGEGMVVKPLNFIAQNEEGHVQPALKIRGREYLRIIYGPEYSQPEHLTRLRSRGLSRKRNMAMGEFKLGLEALRRFTAKEPLRKVHECVFGVLAMESEGVDPRL
jgi:protein phosphatase